MTGSSDGVVRMWSLDYVEVAIATKDDSNKKEENEVDNNFNKAPSLTEAITTEIEYAHDNNLQSITQQLAKKMSLSYESGNETLKSLQEILATNVHATTPKPQRRTNFDGAGGGEVVKGLNISEQIEEEEDLLDGSGSDASLKLQERK